MAHTSSARFRYTGRFLAFVPGKKSPYQKLLLQVVHSDGADDTQPYEIRNIEIKLGKASRRMMVGYLEPYDWVRVIGKEKLDADSGQMRWKAREIVKLSPRQAKALQASYGAIATNLTPASPSRNQQKRAKALATHSAAKSGDKPAKKPVRVLICQKSDCRKRGSLEVQRAVEKTLAETGRTKAVKVQATGCMKRCKAGPNVVMLPAGDKYRRVTPKEARSLIKKTI